LLSPDEYESLKETAAIRSDVPLMKEIRRGLKELKSRKARLYTLDELFK
jgi:PHD/YefM family antitoxin component YafN of YafNO toxin-antitoxin module